MSKYDKMLEVNHKQSVEKIQRAKLKIQEMIEEEDKVTVPKLMQALSSMSSKPSIKSFISLFLPKVLFFIDVQIFSSVAS